MNSVVKPQNNLGGIAQLWLIPSRLISSLLFEPSTLTPALPVNWGDESWAFIPVFQSASYFQDQVTTGAGTAYDQTIQFKIPKIRHDLRLFSSHLSQSRWSALLLDQNGQYLLIGCDSNPLRASAKQTSGADISDLNHMQVTISGQTLEESIFLSTS